METCELCEQRVDHCFCDDEPERWLYFDPEEIAINKTDKPI